MINCKTRLIILSMPNLVSSLYSKIDKIKEVMIRIKQIASKNFTKYLKSRIGFDILFNSFLIFYQFQHLKKNLLYFLQNQNN